jgi:hypothetical protein
MTTAAAFIHLHLRPVAGQENRCREEQTAGEVRKEPAVDAIEGIGARPMAVSF